VNTLKAIRIIDRREKRPNAIISERKARRLFAAYAQLGEFAKLLTLIKGEQK